MTMTRRTIGKLIAATAALLGLPVLTKAATIAEPEGIQKMRARMNELASLEPVPETVADLTAWVEKHFDCKQGDPRSFTIHMPDRPTGPALQAIRGAQPIRYFVIAFGAPNGTEAEVVGALHSEFSKILQRVNEPRPRLYWRHDQHIRLEEKQRPEYGPQMIPLSDVQDRIATVPRGWELDEPSDAFRPVIARTPVMCIYTRLCVVGAPEMNYPADVLAYPST